MNIRNLAIVVASLAIFPAPTRADDARCIVTLNRNALRVSTLQNVEVTRCLRSADRRGVADIEACVGSDARGRIARAEQITHLQDVGGGRDRCDGVAPAFLYRGAEAASGAARRSALTLAHALFGPNLDASVVQDGDSRAGRCRAVVHALGLRSMIIQMRQFLGCTRRALRDGASSNVEVEAACIAAGGPGLADPRGRLARWEQRVERVAGRVCIDTGQNIASLLPGYCAAASGNPEFGQCVNRAVRCEVCRMVNGVNGLGADCDLFDDAAANASCDAFVTYLAGSGNGTLSYGAVRDLAVDDEGNVHVTGGISLGGYATGNAAQASYAGGDADAFVGSFTPHGDLRFFTYLGGSAHDRAYAIEVDDTGIYIGGRAGAGFPTTAGAFQESFGGGGSGEYGPQDGFVAKLSPDGSQWLWVTYVGDNGPEFLRDIDIDESGNVWGAMINVNGSITLLDNAPGSFQGTYGGGNRDAALLKLSADGSSLLYGTYIGGSADEVGAASVRTTSDGGVYYVVSTESDDAPWTPGAYRISRGGLSDVLLLRFDDQGQRLWGTYYGGSGHEGGETHNLGITADDTPVVAMFTTSGDLPDVLNGPLAGSGFVARFSADGQSLLAARYLGGSSFDEIEGVDVRDGRIAVTGGTQSADFPVTPDADLPGTGGAEDGFVAVLPLALDSVSYSTRVPGQHYDWVNGVAIGPDGELVFGGNTRSFDLPATADAYETVPTPQLPTVSPTEIHGGWDAGFVIRLPAP